MEVIQLINKLINRTKHHTIILIKSNILFLLKYTIFAYKLF